MRARIDAGALETQNLLVPEPVDLGPAEAAIALEHRDVLGQLGLRIEPFGGDTVLITGFPAMLANMNPGEILHALLERLVSGGGQPDRRDLLDDMLHTMACKAAIKAGDRLTAAEIAALLGAAAHGRRFAPLPPRPAHGTGFHAGGVGQAVQEGIMGRKGLPWVALTRPPVLAHFPQGFPEVLSGHRRILDTSI